MHWNLIYSRLLGIDYLYVEFSFVEVRNRELKRVVGGVFWLTIISEDFMQDGLKMYQS